MVERKYGCIKQKEDKRDFIYKAPSLKLTLSLPKYVDLRVYDSPVQDQGGLGSCTACATTSALQLLDIKDERPSSMFWANIVYFFVRVYRRLKYVWFRDWYKVFSKNLSRLFVYYNARAIWGTTDEDSGCCIRDAIKSLASLGVCPEKEWQYNNRFNTKPSDSCYQHALKHTVSEYRAITSLDDMKACIASGYPFVFGFLVYSSFDTGDMNKTAIVPLPKPEEECRAAHAVMAVGYDDDKKYFIVRNSWGVMWGKRGYFYMPYDYVSDPELCWDFWTMTRQENK